MPNLSRYNANKARAHSFTLFSANDGTSHQPNCSSITDDELANTIDGVWWSTNGKVKINFVFSLPKMYWLTTPNASSFSLKKVSSEIFNKFQSTVRFGLSKMVQLNNGILNFNEVNRSFKTDYSPFFRGIFYAQTATEASFAANGEGAFTVLRFDNNGYIKQAFINMPTDLYIYTNFDNLIPIDWTNNTISHETSHALGGQHLQNYPDIATKLENTPDGVFCSVMDYYNLITTNISRCKQNCTPDYAIYPGPLDIRAMQLAYLHDKYDHDYNKDYHYFINAVEYAILFVIVTSIYTSVDNVISGFRVKNKTIIPTKTTQTLLNIIMLVVFSEMDAPEYLLILFAISASLKLLPERLLKRYPFYNDHPMIDKIIKSHFPLYILAFTCMFVDGHMPLALLYSTTLISFAVLIGSLVGRLSKLSLSSCTNRLLDKIANYYFGVPPEQAIEMAIRPNIIIFDEVNEEKVEQPQHIIEVEDADEKESVVDVFAATNPYTFYKIKENLERTITVEADEIEHESLRLQGLAFH